MENPDDKPLTVGAFRAALKEQASDTPPTHKLHPERRERATFETLSGKSNMARGGKRDGAGRPKGAVNKATADIREAAQEFTAQALAVLVEVMTTGDSAAARVAAANSVLDRGHGKPTQPIAGDDAADPIRHTFEWLPSE